MRVRSGDPPKIRGWAAWGGAAKIGVMDEVRREGDDELCGHVEDGLAVWAALTVFGTVLGMHETREAAVEQVLAEGLASLAERWTLHDASIGEDEVVCILEANAAEVTVARDYYPGPGVPTLRITREQLAAGEWELRR